jgi:N-acetyltransferase
MSAKKSTPFKQLTLNFGQKSPRSTKCQECGMVFNSNDKEDEQIHHKYHREKDSILKYNQLKNEKVVAEYFDGKCIVIEYGVDLKQSTNKALQLLDYVDNQLGINELNRFKFEMYNENVGFSNNRSIKTFSKFYLFISAATKRIVGFCMAEQIDQSHKIMCLSSENQNEAISVDKEKTKEVICGINRIWVSSEARRNRIATRLLDCVCKNFLFVQNIGNNKLAFSDPTEFGKLLAKSYAKTNSVFVYTSVQNN